jgi:phosphatidylglycerophosphate synthase
MLVMNVLDEGRNAVRGVMRRIARGLHSVSGGSITPNTITLVGFMAHVPIAYLIAMQQYVLAAVFLLIFGLFDALDGELARLQGKASSAGMVLDASTDRMKEVLLYTGVAYALASTVTPTDVAWAVAACGASLCVSYVKAKGETAVQDSDLTPNQINRLFADGLMRFEIRMLILIVGLLADQLVLAVAAIAVGSTLTAFSRLIRITRKLSS